MVVGIGNEVTVCGGRNGSIHSIIGIVVLTVVVIIVIALVMLLFKQYLFRRLKCMLHLFPLFWPFIEFCFIKLLPLQSL